MINIDNNKIVNNSNSNNKITVNIVKHNKTIAHINNIENMTIDRIISLLQAGYALIPR